MLIPSKLRLCESKLASTSMSAASDLSLFLAMKTNDKIIIIIKMLIAIDKIGTKSWLLVTIGSSCCVLLDASELNAGS